MARLDYAGRHSSASPRIPGVPQQQVGDGSAALAGLHTSWAAPLVPVPTADAAVKALRVCSYALRPWALQGDVVLIDTSKVPEIGEAVLVTFRDGWTIVATLCGFSDDVVALDALCGPSVGLCVARRSVEVVYPVAAVLSARWVPEEVCHG
jgi:hypothetical protein